MKLEKPTYHFWKLIDIPNVRCFSSVSSITCLFSIEHFGVCIKCLTDGDDVCGVSCGGLYDGSWRCAPYPFSIETVVVQQKKPAARCFVSVILAKVMGWFCYKMG